MIKQNNILRVIGVLIVLVFHAIDVEWQNQIVVTYDFWSSWLTHEDEADEAWENKYT